MSANKTIYYLTVSTKTALHIGATEKNDVSDSLFYRNTRGELTLQGTSIAGAIRSHLTRIAPVMTGTDRKVVCDGLDINQIDKTKACSCIVCHLMGDIRPLNEIRDVSHDEIERLKGRASRLIVYDAIIQPDKTHIRDGVGIDRNTGTSARQAFAKFDFETIPANDEFKIMLELEDADKIDLYLLKLALCEWKDHRLRFGGNKSRGTGVLYLKKVEKTEFLLDQQSGLMSFLRRNLKEQDLSKDPVECADVSRIYHKDHNDVSGSVQSWLTIDFTLKSQGFFLTNDTTQAIAENYNHKSLQFLPGASLRGAIRSQAERISRTLVNLHVNNEQEFLQKCPAPHLFVINDDKGLESSVTRIQRSKDVNALRNDPNNYDLSEQLFGSVDWGSRLFVEDASLIGETSWKKLDFVAIDRFTGGAADSAKFDAHALWKPSFQCRLHLEAPQSWEIGWLLYVLKDMIDGRVPVGYGSAKGFGDVQLQDLKLTLGYAYPEAAPHTDLAISPPNAKNNCFYLKKSFNGWDEVAKTGWMKAWNTHLETYQVAVPHTHLGDPYWNEEANHYLYQKETAIHDILK